LNLNQITIPCKNVPEAIEFYKLLGLKLIVHTHDQYARFECPKGESTFSLHKVEEISGGSKPIIYFEVDSVQKTYESLKNNGVEFKSIPEEKPWLWTEVSLQDLDGNEILIYHAGDNRKYAPWRIHSEEKSKSSLEIERKFLVHSDHFKNQVVSKHYLIQGFLNTHPERTVRVRVKDDQGFLTVKGLSSEDGTTRFEWEKLISKKEAESLLQLCEEGIIEKERYEIQIDNTLFEVDVFLGANEGLTLAEIELPSIDAAFPKPQWLGEEVTGDIKYYNSQLSKQPYNTWNHET